MPGFGPVLEEISEAIKTGREKPFDVVIRKYLGEINQHTGRDIIFYGSKFTRSSEGVSPELTMINESDLQAFMTVMQGLKGPNLDLILHTPGGMTDSAEAIGKYLRSKFTHIRIFVPSLAMSAGTMLACLGDEIVMGNHSFLGPIDPQLVMNTPLGFRRVAAQAIQKQFRMGLEECAADKTKLMVWAPILSSYAPDLLIASQQAIERSQDIVETWLKTYRFANDPNKDQKAAAIAKWLADDSDHKSHAKHLSRDDLRANGLEITNLENDKKLRDLVLSIFHAVTIVMDMTTSVKYLTNHEGKTFVHNANVRQPAPTIVQNIGFIRRLLKLALKIW